MNIRSKILAVLGLVCLMHTSFGQSLSNKGRDFWVGYGLHQFMESGGNNSQEMVLYLSAEQAANVTVRIEGTTWVRNYAVPANSVIISDLIPKSGAFDARLISLPCTFVPPGTPCGGEGIFVNKGIHITSDVPIVAYAHIYGSASSGATMLMPVETWGYSYTTLNSNQSYASSPSTFSWAYAIAQNDNTVIEVTPTALTRSGRPANNSYTITLNRGEIYQLMAGPEGTGAKPHLSGTKIKSIANAAGECYPIAVFAGSSRTSNPLSCGSGGGDNDNQQCFPTQAWGKRYLTAPTSSSTNASTRMTNLFRIAIKEPGTNVYRDGTLLTTLIANSYYEFTTNEPSYITADKPIMVAQYMSGGSCLNGGLGDPEMMYISPIEQGIKRVGFYRNDEENITVNYLTLIIPTAGVASLTIDGSSAFDHTYPHPRLAGYTVVVKRWTGAKAQAVAQSDSAFTAITYGLGSVESYGYNAGTLINNLNAVGSIFNSSDTSSTTTEHPFTCINTPVELSILLAYQPTKLVWKLSTVGPVLTPNADVVDNAPVPVGPPVLVNGVPYYKYTLPGTYKFSAMGTYTIPLLSTHPSIENCNNTESVSFLVTVQGKPTAGYTYTHSGCVTDAVVFTGPASSTNGYTFNQWEYTLPGGVTYNSQSPTHTFPAPGNQLVNLHMVTTEGCVADSALTIPISPRPTTTFGTTPASICEDGTITFSDTTVFSGTGTVNSYYWNFGNGNQVTVGTNANQVQTYPDYGVFTVKHAVGVSTTCVSDTAIKTVRVWAKPFVPFTYPAGCLPSGGLVQFDSDAFAPDGQSIVSHSWNFGDPNANAGNPNTSTIADPTHTYTAVGNYTITYSVTTANGCTKDTTIVASFNPPPILAYPALSSVCENGPSVSVATASVTNGAPGSGVYVGPPGSTTAAGIFNPAVAGPGSHTIWYVFSATSGCTDSISQTITVKPTPDPSFSIANSGCLNASGLVQFNYDSIPLTGQSYLWTFGDPNANAGNPNTSTAQNPTHIYQPGTYTINLQISAAGCVKDSTITTTFNLKPALNYPALAPVCQSVTGTVSVATATVTNGVTGTGIYVGPGTTSTGNFSPSIAGPGTHTIKYIFTGTGNCVDSISRTILVYPKPNAAFSAPTACLNSNGIAQFTYSGSVTAGQTYLWNFNDPNANAGNPNTSTAQNPTHIFTNTGSYNISVTVTDANTCTDDSVRNITLSVKPALNYPALAPVCESASGTVNVATATVTNGVTGTGIYQGPGTSAAGNFDPAIAGPGVHTIWYIFTSSANCIDSTSQNIAVSSKPTAAYTVSPTTACLPVNGQVQFTYTGSTGSGETLLWNFDDPNANAGNPNTSSATNPIHNYTNTGTYNVSLTVTNANGCTDEEIITNVFSVTPDILYPPLAAICETEAAPVSVATATVTNNVTGTGVYSGPGTDAAGNFNPLAAGPGTHLITYTFTSTGNCVNTKTSSITVNPAPRASFSIPGAACLPTSGQVQFTYNGTPITGQTYLWNFDDPNANAGNPNTSTVASPTHNYTNTGTYDVELIVTAPNGCVHDTTITNVFSVTPALSFAPLTSVCESVTGTVSVANAAVTNNVTGTGVYSGPGTDAAGNFNPSVAGAGIHPVTYTFTSTGNCVQSITENIEVFAKPSAGFAHNGGACLPVNGQVQFTYDGSLEAGQTYLWNFDDPNATAGNPNTSTFANPTHNYTGNGTYTVLLTVTNANGCVDDHSETTDFNVTPELAFTPLNAVCESQAGTVSVANASVINNVPGSGVYSGAGTDAAGNFNPSVAGAGTHTITYTFTSSANCVSTSTRDIVVHPKPSAAFTTSADICLDQQAQFSSTSSVPTGSISSWNWNFGDGAPVSYNNGNPFTHPYTAFGTYYATLVTVSDNGCISDTARQTVKVHAMPVADFTPPASVCMPGGTALFTNGSSAPDNAGLTYQWNFGDGSAPTTAVNGSHVYGAINDYSVTLTATSEFGCATQVVKQFSQFFDKPVAQGTVSPETLCQGTENEFRDASFAPNSTISSRLWIFGDGTTSGASSYDKIYRNPGTYEVKLVATSAEGCVSDTFRRTVVVHLQPVVDAGHSFVVPLGSTITFMPNVNSTSLDFTWTPPTGLSNPNILNPTLVANFDQQYMLTATGNGNCTASDILTVKVLKPVKIPNAFSPNGDGTNDTWILENLADYPGARVDVFNRYGQLVFSSVGYSVPWDGKYKGKPLPFATYYYVIDMKNGFKPLNGSITIIR